MRDGNVIENIGGKSSKATPVPLKSHLKN